jgi:CDGSH-type Zn-finger protein
VQPRGEVVIVPYRDGPYLVRGPVVMRDQRGEAIALSRRPTALCRCGKSRIRPFCDGTHQLIRFSAPSEPELASAGEPELRIPRRVSAKEQSAAAQPQPARAAVGAAQEIVNRALETAPHGPARTGMRQAQALLVGASRLLDDHRRLRGSDDAALFLIQGAVQALAPLRSAGEEPAVRAVTELQRAAAGLEEHHDDA